MRKRYPETCSATSQSSPWSAQRRRFKQFAARIGLVLLWLSIEAPVHGDVSEVAPQEEQVKAAFLYKFFSFIEWPTPPEDSGAYKIGVLGDSRLLPILESLEGRQLGDRRLEILHFHGLEEIEYCHILFVALSKSYDLPTVLHRLEGQATLTVGDNRSFVSQGGMVGFYREGKKVRFAINVEAALEADLLISSKLLRLATVYRGENDGDEP